MNGESIVRVIKYGLAKSGVITAQRLKKDDMIVGGSDCLPSSAIMCKIEARSTSPRATKMYCAVY